MSTKRKLDFQNKALNGQTFYVDIKAETLRRKVTRRIKELGGCIEGFLSKDIDLVLTDKNNGEIKRPKDPKSVQTTNLSRGMNATSLYTIISVQTGLSKCKINVKLYTAVVCDTNSTGYCTIPEIFNNHNI